MREFAKRERANSWQSTEIFCGVFGVLGVVYGLPRSLCSLAMTDKENALCHFTMTADFVILTSQYDKQMLVILSLCKRRKIHILILWILRFAQYDKGFEILHFATQSSV